GTTPPTEPDARANDIMIGADGNLTRPAAGGALAPADVPASAVSAASGDGQ
ncbi:MAG: hypothetical protein JHC92_04255, partial [Sphingomonadaceae bacterium]|nr:hypothetical protein [Sphingomonadaceae bacterium]